MLSESPIVRNVNDSISETVIVAVAEARNVDPVELDIPLYDVIDPDALDSLFRSDDSSVEFTMAGCHVIVCGSGRVIVAPEAVDS